MKFNLDLIKSNSSSVIVFFFLIIFSVFVGLSCISASDVDSNSTVLNDAVKVNYTCDYPGVDENVLIGVVCADDINDTASDLVSDSDNTNDTDMGSNDVNVTPVQNVSKEKTFDDLAKMLAKDKKEMIGLNITFVGDKDFIMSVKYHENPNHGHYVMREHWYMSHRSNGVELISMNKELDNSTNSTFWGCDGRMYFKFHIISDDYYVALEKRSGIMQYITDTVDTSSINGYNPRPFNILDIYC